MRKEAIQILGESELVERLGHGESHFSHCISIRNPDETMPRVIKESFQSILELRFYDAEDVDQLGPDQRIKRVPERKDIRGVIQWFSDTRGAASGYTLHCWQGLSRSPAIALGILFLLTGSESEAGRLLRQIRPEARPHQKIVKLFDQELGCNLTKVNDAIRGDAVTSLLKDLEASTASHTAGRNKEENGLLSKARAIRQS